MTIRLHYLIKDQIENWKGYVDFEGKTSEDILQKILNFIEAQGFTKDDNAPLLEEVSSEICQA